MQAANTEPAGKKNYAEAKSKFLTTPLAYGTVASTCVCWSCKKKGGGCMVPSDPA